MLVGELAKRVGRTTETIKRWVDDGLLDCQRDDRNRRIFSDEDFERCLEIVRLSNTAQVQNRKLSELAKDLPEQLRLMP